MATIDEMQYGYDANKIREYLKEIKSDALTTAVSVLENTSEIIQCCEQNWEGEARENFVKNLKRDVKHVVEQIDQLYVILQNEVYSIQNAMGEKDSQLIGLD